MFPHGARSRLTGNLCSHVWPEAPAQMQIPFTRMGANFSCQLVGWPQIRRMLPQQHKKASEAVPENGSCTTSARKMVELARSRMQQLGRQIGLRNGATDVTPSGGGERFGSAGRKCVVFLKSSVTELPHT